MATAEKVEPVEAFSDAMQFPKAARRGTKDGKGSPARGKGRTSRSPRKSGTPQSGRPVVLGITSDQHAGSTVALCPPEVSLDDGGKYLSSKPQAWLYNNWLSLHARIGEVRDALDADLYLMFNGDMTDGDHHGTTQILSGNPTAQAAVVNEIMRAPLALKPDKMWFIRGTEAHVGKSACYEERIALGLKKDGWPVVCDTVLGTASHWHAKMLINDVLLDFAHHGRVGQRPWTKQNITSLLAFQIWVEHHKRGERHPDLAIRSHMHQFVDTGAAHDTRVIQMPAWQLHTAFTHKVVTESMADIGGLIVIIKDGRYEVEPMLFKAASVPTWTRA